jgi:hypothetical protein
MPKKLLATTIIIALAITMLSAMSLVSANFMPLHNGVNILSPSITTNPYFHYNYQNSTVNLTISVYYVKEGLTEPPKVSVISYSLDGQPLAYLRNLTMTKWYYSQYNQDITNYSTTTTLANLSEGNHTIQANANDMSTSKTFTVDSHYVVPIIKILSPTNQTYTNNVPLVFTVNSNFTNATYTMYTGILDNRFEGIGHIFNGQLRGNSSVQNLPNGNYFMDLWAITNKGEHIEASANFTINTGSTLPIELNPTSLTAIVIVIVILVITLVSLVYFKKKKGKA